MAKSEFVGDVLSVRAVEDAIRATKKYSESLSTRSIKHPIQGAEFPSRVLTKKYEVYPDMEIGMNMSVWDFSDWIWGDTPHVDIDFYYNYLRNKAMVTVHGANGVIEQLREGIPGFGETLAKVTNGSQPT